MRAMRFEPAVSAVLVVFECIIHQILSKQTRSSPGHTCREDRYRGRKPSAFSL